MANVNDEVENIVHDAQLIQQLDISEELIENAVEVESLAEEYGVLFNAVADLYIERGLTQDLGLRGNFEVQPVKSKQLLQKIIRMVQ